MLLVKKIYPLIRALDKDKSSKEETRCCDYFIKEIMTKDDAMNVYTILKKWIIDREVVDIKLKHYIRPSKEEGKKLLLNSTHIRKLIRVFHMAFGWQHKNSDKLTYPGLIKTWGSLLADLIESMCEYLSPENCIKNMNATLAKWKQRQMISRSVIHEAIRKANAVTRAHIARREEKAKRRKRKHMEGSTSDNKNNSNSTIFTTTSTTADDNNMYNNNNNNIDNSNYKKSRVDSFLSNESLQGERKDNKSTRKEDHEEEEEQEELDEDISCVTPPPMQSDDIDEDDEVDAVKNKKMDYEEYVRNANEDRILKGIEAERKYNSIDFKTISINTYINKRKTLVPNIFNDERDEALEKEKRDQNIRKTIHAKEDANTGIIYSDSDEDDEDENDTIDYRKIFRPPIPSPIGEIIRADCIGEMMKSMMNVLFHAKQPDGSDSYNASNTAFSNNSSFDDSNNTSNDNELTPIVTDSVDAEIDNLLNDAYDDDNNDNFNDNGSNSIETNTSWEGSTVTPWGNTTATSFNALEETTEATTTTTTTTTTTNELNVASTLSTSASVFDTKKWRKAIGKLIGNYIFDLIGISYLEEKAMTSDKFATRMLYNQYKESMKLALDPLFGIPCEPSGITDNSKRFQSFQSRLRIIEDFENHNMNPTTVKTLFTYIERECFAKNISSIRRPQAFLSTSSYKINIKRQHSSTSKNDMLLELELVQVNSSGEQWEHNASNNSNTVQILESHFNLLKESYILHQSSLLELVKHKDEPNFDYEEDDKVNAEGGDKKHGGKERKKKATIENMDLSNENENVFLGYVFALVTRYETLFSANAGSQSAIPPPVFSVLKKYLNVDGECFASPLNHQLPLYFSAFQDIDKVFGSLGPFFETDNPIEGGSWQCNPPFDVNSIFVALRTISTILHKAEQGNKSVTFSVFFADVSQNQGVESVINSMGCYKRADTIIKEHCYMYGFRHRPINSGQFRNTARNDSTRMNIFWEPRRVTRFLIFQTTAAFQELCHNDLKHVEKIVGEIREAFAHNINVAKNEWRY